MWQKKNHSNLALQSFVVACSYSKHQKASTTLTSCTTLQLRGKNKFVMVPMPSKSNAELKSHKCEITPAMICYWARPNPPGWGAMTSLLIQWATTSSAVCHYKETKRSELLKSQLSLLIIAIYLRMMKVSPLKHLFLKWSQKPWDAGYWIGFSLLHGWKFPWEECYYLAFCNALCSKCLLWSSYDEQLDKLHKPADCCGRCGAICSLKFHESSIGFCHTVRTTLCHKLLQQYLREERLKWLVHHNADLKPTRIEVAQ